MTCAAAYIDSEGKTAIGADRLCSGSSYQFLLESKLHYLGEGWHTACAGSSLWRRFAADFAARENTGADNVPLEFAEAWVRWAQGRGHGDTSTGHWRCNGEWLLVRKGEIVLVGSDGALLMPQEPYAAIGSGAAVAIGALCAEWRRGRSSDEAVRSALRAAHKHADGISSEIAIVEFT